MPSRFRVSPRLKDFDYLGCLAAHITVVTRQRRPLFAEPELAVVAERALVEACESRSGHLHAWCLMPDHVHFLVEVGAGHSLEDLVKRFKQLSGFRLKQLTGESAWQVSYYDHVLRREEDLMDVANYIWGNPVAAGLVQDAHDYPFSGPKEVFEEGRAAVQA